MRIRRLLCSLHLIASVITGQSALCQLAKETNDPGHTHTESVFEKFAKLSTSKPALLNSNDLNTGYKDHNNPLGPKANELHKQTNQSLDTINLLKAGLWIKLENQMFLYKDSNIWSVSGDSSLKLRDLNQCEKIIRKTVKKLKELESGSSYARNIIRVLQHSVNQFVIKLVNITESYTLFPINADRVGFLNNEAYAFQIIEKGSLMVNYAPFEKIGSDAEIRWTPTLGMMSLAHELAHAYDANYGLLNDELMHAYSEVMSTREIRALYHENIIRKELKLRLKLDANTGRPFLWEGMPFTYPLPVSARY